jgi:plastocyanin
MRLVRVAVALAAIAGFALAAAYALGDDLISSAPTCQSASDCQYSASTFTITGGQVAQFHNATAGGGGIYGGTTSHSVLANDSKTLNGMPLFSSKIIPSGSTTAVNGTQYLAPGTYVFHCAVHGPSMSATLQVVGGTPVARPKLSLKLSSGKLAKVRRSGKLKATVGDTGSKASGVVVTASMGSHKLAKKGGISVAANQAKPVTLKLSKNGAKALKGASKARVELKGTVPFGHAAKAKRTLH